MNDKEPTARIDYWHVLFQWTLTMALAFGPLIIYGETLPWWSGYFFGMLGATFASKCTDICFRAKS